MSICQCQGMVSETIGNLKVDIGRLIVDGMCSDLCCVILRELLGYYIYHEHVAIFNMELMMS